MTDHLRTRKSAASGLHCALGEGSGREVAWFLLLHGWNGDERSMSALAPVLPPDAFTIAVRASYPAAQVERARGDAERLRGSGAEIAFCESDVGHKLELECTRGLRFWLDGAQRGRLAE